MSKINNIKKDYLQVIHIKKNHYSSQKLLPKNKENKLPTRYKSNKILNNYVEENINNKNYNNINDIDIKNNISTNISEEEDLLIIYEKIKYTLENFIEINKGNNKLLFKTLNQIYNYINSRLCLLSKNNETINSQKNVENSKNNWVDYKSKILYEMKIDELNRKIKELNHRIELLNMNDDSKKNDIINKKFGSYNSLKKKIFQLESKLKLNEFKYLLCIKELQNKISNLEKELNIKKLEVEYGDMKERRCFPYLNQYNYKDNINPKSIPLTKSILKNISHDKRRKYVDNQNIIKNVNKDSFLTITNTSSIINRIKTNKTNNTRTEYRNRKTSVEPSFFKKLIIKNLKEGDNNGDSQKQLNSENVMLKSVDFLKQNNLEEDDDLYDNIYSIKKLSSRLEEDNMNIKNLNNINDENIINKETKYFISHPNLTIAGMDGKKSKYSNGLPNKMFSFKFSKNLEKNAFFIFPSVLKETLVNLEKLRINKNYIDKDDKR